jgi:hypothetical protein
MMDATFKIAPGPVVLGMRAPETVLAASTRKEVGRSEELVNFMLGLDACCECLENEVAFIRSNAGGVNIARPTSKDISVGLVVRISERYWR